MKIYPSSAIITANSIFEEFDGNVISKFIDLLNINNLNIMLLTKTHDHYDQKEKWFGTEYTTIGKIFI